MPATITRDLRVETLEDRQLMHGGSMVGDAPVVSDGPVEATGYVAFLKAAANSETVDECAPSAIDACFGEAEEEEQNDVWTATAWGGLAFCVSSVFNQTVLSTSARGYVFDLRRLGRKRSHDAIPATPVC